MSTGGIQNRNLSKRAAADLHLSQRGYRDRPIVASFKKSRHYDYQLLETSQFNRCVLTDIKQFKVFFS